jgi:C-terminal processing protease CtpA/Prc
VPFKAGFIEQKLVVTGYYKDTLSVKEKFKRGDIITSINGTPIAELIKKYLPITPASNYDAQLRDLAGGFLLRNKKQQFTFGVVRNNKPMQLSFKGGEISKTNFSDWIYDPKQPGYSLINKQIGYVFPGKYKNADSVDMKKTFAGTKGIIIDMRCYPSDDMTVFDKYIKPFNSPFVRFSAGSINHPGSFTYLPLVNSGQKNNDNYKGKVVVIVNAVTQSNAEFVTMAFQSDSRVIVIGSTTAGADGNVSEIVFPGGISTSISGIGVFYPDGTNAQRKGVKINYVVKPTIQGIKAGRDEPLEKAKQLIMTN